MSGAIDLFADLLGAGGEFAPSFAPFAQNSPFIRPEEIQQPCGFSPNSPFSPQSNTANPPANDAGTVDLAPVLRWLHFIGENSQPIIDEVLAKCRTDPAALEYYRQRAQEVPQSGEHAEEGGPVRCTGCRHFQPDPINPAQGIGACLAGAGQRGRPLYPHAIRWCVAFQTGGQ